jgi:hypothetical protein
MHDVEEFVLYLHTVAPIRTDAWRNSISKYPTEP